MLLFWYSLWFFFFSVECKLLLTFCFTLLIFSPVSVLVCFTSNSFWCRLARSTSGNNELPNVSLSSAMRVSRKFRATPEGSVLAVGRMWFYVLSHHSLVSKKAICGLLLLFKTMLQEKLLSNRINVFSLSFCLCVCCRYLEITIISGTAGWWRGLYRNTEEHTFVCAESPRYG